MRIERATSFSFQALPFAHKFIENELLFLAIIECKMHFLSITTTQGTMIRSIFVVSNI